MYNYFSLNTADVFRWCSNQCTNAHQCAMRDPQMYCGSNCDRQKNELLSDPVAARGYENLKRARAVDEDPHVFFFFSSCDKSALCST